MALIGYPIYGTFEIATFMTAGVIAFGLAFCGMNGAHITVYFLTDKFPPKFRKVVLVTNSFLSIFICIIIGVRCWSYAADAQAKGEVTSALYLPTYPIIYILSISFIILALAFLVEFITRLKGYESNAEGAAEDAMVQEILKDAETRRLSEDGEAADNTGSGEVER
jgi:TRAP-type C4-dicarboxylate transport system permease small subunit